MKQLLVILVSLASFSALGQEVTIVHCGNGDRKSLEEVRKQFPYSQTHSVKIVSYKGYDSIPKTAGQIDFQKMFEVKTLDKAQIDEIFDLLANYENKAGVMDVNFCWDPKNGIVFLDQDGRVVTYIDICFTCKRYYVPNPTLFPFFCNEKMDAIKELMRRNGITYGMRNHEPIEPSNNKGHWHNKEGIYLVVDEPPEFPGESEALHKFITDNLRYPGSSRKKKVEGKVFVEFIVEPDGSIKEASVIKGMGGDFDEEALRIIQSMPKWKPGKVENEFVRVRYILPIKF